MRRRSGQPGSPYIIGRGRFLGYLIYVLLDVIARLTLSVVVCRFEDSAEFPRLYSLPSFSAYIKMFWSLYVMYVIPVCLCLHLFSNASNMS